MVSTPPAPPCQGGEKKKPVPLPRGGGERSRRPIEYGGHPTQRVPPVTDRTQVVEKLAEILRAHTEVDTSALTEASHIRDELGLDSLDLMDVVMRIEEAYKIRLTHQDLEKAETIADLVSLIIGKSATRAA